ncbi:MAG TPA: ABC transporter substrate-binding protein [Blastocatellia bacterium]|nr:ABC transporter substrate-binding protein [Blastocatellia bacterium]
MTASSAFRPPDDGGFTPQEQRGREIYLRGKSPSGKGITAVMGNGGAEIPAATIACVNCHGRDGLGKTEGGVSPSNLTWDSLTKPYTVTTPSGRRHAAYDEPLLKRAITMGIDPGGNQLQVAMPRYRMTLEDMADLIAYLKKLGKSNDPGLTPTAIQVGTVVPGEGPLSEMGKALSSVVEAYFEELNTQGGIFGRKIEVHVLSGASGDVKRSIDAGNLFALVSPFTAGGDKAFADLFEDEHIPVVGPVTLLPQAGSPTSRQTFYLYSGPAEQVRALFAFAATGVKPPARRVAVVCPDNQVTSGLIPLVQEQSQKLGLKLVAANNYLDGRLDARQSAAQLREADPDTVFFFGNSDEERSLAKELDGLNFRPNLLLVGSLAGRGMFDLPAGFNGRVFLSYPTVPSDRSAEAMAGFVRLARKYKLNSQHFTAQISAYSAAEVLTEGLRLAGRELARERLVDALEGLSNFDTGLMPKISYGPNRRIGARGAYVMGIDLEKKQLTPASGWIEAPD